MTGGPRTFSFALEMLPPGTYYIEACITVAQSVGCAPYTAGDPLGRTAPIVIRSGEETSVQVRF